MGKFTMEVITAHNGSEVISIRSTSYSYTQFDKIIADWREQERHRISEKRKNKGKIFRIFFRKSA